MCATSKPLELRFHAFLVVLLTTRKCHNSLENHGRNEHYTFFIFTSTWRYYTPLCKQQRYLQRNNIFNEATSSRSQQVSIQRSPHDVFTPPHPPFCKQQRYLQRNNIFNEATSSRFQQVSTQRSPHDVITPPHPPSVNNNDTCNVTTSSTKQHPQGFNKSQCNAVHMTFLHPPTPPFCKQQRYLQCNNIFNEATSSRCQQVSIQRSPHDVITPSPPPHPSSLYHNDVYSTWQDWGFLEAPGNPQPWPYIFIRDQINKYTYLYKIK